MRRGLGFWALWVLALTGLGSGCAMPQKKRDGLVLGAMTGAIVGGGAGAGIASSGDRDDLGPGIAIGAVGGAVIGGLIGYLLAGEEAPPPPPSAPPTRSAPPPPAAPPLRESKKIILRGINFDFDKSNIKREFVPVLDEAAQILKDNSSVKVTIEGHTDSKGTDAYNQKLTEGRANAVKHYLVSKGVMADRLDTVGKGESQPIAPNTKPNGKDNPEGRAMNRRAELKVQ